MLWSGAVFPVDPGPAPLLLCPASPVDGAVPAAPLVVLEELCAPGELSGALLPVEPGPAPLLLCAASPEEVGGGVAAVVLLLVPVVVAVSSARAEYESPNAATVIMVQNNLLVFMVVFHASESGYGMDLRKIIPTFLLLHAS